MCNLYSLTRPRAEVLKHFRVSDNHAPAWNDMPALFPAATAPVIRARDDGDREAVLMSWGFVLPQAGKAPRRVTNVRDDKIRSSKFWTPSFSSRRCLVPASSYSEPNGQTPAAWAWFALRGDVGRPLFAFPGIWRSWVGPVKKTWSRGRA